MQLDWDEMDEEPELTVQDVVEVNEDIQRWKDLFKGAEDMSGDEPITQYGEG